MKSIIACCIYLWIVQITFSTANTVVDCEKQVCIPNTFRSLQSTESVLLKTSWDQLISIFRPHHLNIVSELWLNNTNNKTTALSLGSVIRRLHNINTLNLLNYSYNAIQIPLDGKQNFRYRSLKSVNGLNVKYLTSETLKWLGGLETLQITLADSARSRYPHLGKVKGLNIFAPHTFTLNAMYFGKHCHIEHLHINMPQTLEIMPPALMKCRNLKSLTIIAPKLTLNSKLIHYNINLIKLNLQIQAISPTSSISNLVCKFHHNKICLIDEIKLSKHSDSS